MQDLHLRLWKMRPAFGIL